MDTVNGVQVNVAVHDRSEGFDPDMSREWSEGYDAGFAQGWCEAACEALENYYTHYGDMPWAKELLYPELDENEGMAALIDELMDDFVTEVEELAALERRPNAYEETPIGLGRRGEDAACRYLESKGYEILERNWTCPYGEADIIARDEDGTVCFIEVKTRRGERAGVPEEAVTPEKRRRYENIALAFMSSFWERSTPVRFDAIGITVDRVDHALLRHVMGYFNDVRGY